MWWHWHCGGYCFWHLQIHMTDPRYLFYARDGLLKTTEHLQQAVQDSEKILQNFSTEGLPQNQNDIDRCLYEKTYHTCTNSSRYECMEGTLSTAVGSQPTTRSTTKTAGQKSDWTEKPGQRGGTSSRQHRTRLRGNVRRDNETPAEETGEREGRDRVAAEGVRVEAGPGSCSECWPYSCTGKITCTDCMMHSSSPGLVSNFNKIMLKFMWKCMGLRELHNMVD